MALASYCREREKKRKKETFSPRLLKKKGLCERGAPSGFRKFTSLCYAVKHSAKRNTRQFCRTKQKERTKKKKKKGIEFFFFSIFLRLLLLCSGARVKRKGGLYTMLYVLLITTLWTWPAKKKEKEALNLVVDGRVWTASSVMLVIKQAARVVGGKEIRFCIYCPVVRGRLYWTWAVCPLLKLPPFHYRRKYIKGGRCFSLSPCCFQEPHLSALRVCIILWDEELCVL